MIVKQSKAKYFVTILFSCLSSQEDEKKYSKVKSECIFLFIFYLPGYSVEDVQARKQEQEKNIYLLENIWLYSPTKSDNAVIHGSLAI